MVLEMRLLCVVNKRACVFLRFAGSMLRIINSILSIRIRQRRGHTSAPLEPNSPGRLLTGSRKRKGRERKEVEGAISTKKGRQEIGWLTVGVRPTKRRVTDREILWVGSKGQSFGHVQTDILKLGEFGYRRMTPEREARYYVVVRITGHESNDSTATSRHGDSSSQGTGRKRVARSGRRTSNTFERKQPRDGEEKQTRKGEQEEEARGDTRSSHHEKGKVTGRKGWIDGLLVLLTGSVMSAPAGKSRKRPVIFTRVQTHRREARPNQIY